MSRAIPTVRLGAGASVGAPESGVRLGRDSGGPVSVRLFRLIGSRIAVAGLVEAAQLLAIRAASGGTPVQVLTGRPHLWEPLVRHGRASQVLAPEAVPGAPTGPSLLIDDRPTRERPAGERAPWQCVLDVRGQWRGDDLASLAHNDLTVFGSVPTTLMSALASAYGLARGGSDLDRLARVAPGSVAVLRRGRVGFVDLDPSAAEYHLIEGARAAAPAWRP